MIIFLYLLWHRHLDRMEKEKNVIVFLTNKETYYNIRFLFLEPKRRKTKTLTKWFLTAVLEIRAMFVIVMSL